MRWVEGQEEPLVEPLVQQELLVAQLESLVGAQPKRAATPPRDSKDVRCGNCGGVGHTAQQCNKPRIPMEERKCHTCGKPGHLARNCPDNKKANVAEQEAPAAGFGRVLCMEDDDGFTTVARRPQSRPLTFGDMPVIQRLPQGDRKRSHGNRFGALDDSSPSVSSKETETRQNSQRPGRNVRREEVSLCSAFSPAFGRGESASVAAHVNQQLLPEPLMLGMPPRHTSQTTMIAPAPQPTTSWVPTTPQNALGVTGPCATATVTSPTSMR